MSCNTLYFRFGNDFKQTLSNPLNPTTFSGLKIFRLNIRNGIVRDRNTRDRLFIWRGREYRKKILNVLILLKILILRRIEFLRFFRIGRKNLGY